MAKRVPWNKGLPTSEETRKKISQKLTGRKMPYVAEANKNRVISQEVRTKRSEVAKKLWSNPDYVAMMKKQVGENSPSYIKDRTKLKTDRLKQFDTQYKYWMLSVKKRDGWKCKIANEECCGRLEAHHILGWASHPNLRYNLNNGITLCRFHHPLKRDDEKRLSSFFQELVKS